jgi:hypothetical protein
VAAPEHRRCEIKTDPRTCYYGTDR